MGPCSTGETTHRRAHPAWVPHSATPARRSWGNAPTPSPRPVPGRPSSASFSGVGHVQGRAVDTHEPPAPVEGARRLGPAIELQACSKSSSSGSGPSLVRARNIAPFRIKARSRLQRGPAQLDPPLSCGLPDAKNGADALYGRRAVGRARFNELSSRCEWLVFDFGPLVVTTSISDHFIHFWRVRGAICYKADIC